MRDNELIPIALLVGIALGLMCSRRKEMHFILKEYENDIVVREFFVNRDLLGRHKTPSGDYEIILESARDVPLTLKLKGK